MPRLRQTQPRRAESREERTSAAACVRDTRSTHRQPATRREMRERDSRVSTVCLVRSCESRVGVVCVDPTSRHRRRRRRLRRRSDPRSADA
jgi:hypothetical protein